MSLQSQHCKRKRSFCRRVSASRYLGALGKDGLGEPLLTPRHSPAALEVPRAMRGAVARAARRRGCQPTLAVRGSGTWVAPRRRLPSPPGEPAAAPISPCRVPPQQVHCPFRWDSPPGPGGPRPWVPAEPVHCGGVGWHGQPFPVPGAATAPSDPLPAPCKE